MRVSSDPRASSGSPYIVNAAPSATMLFPVDLQCIPDSLGSLLGVCNRQSRHVGKGTLRSPARRLIYVVRHVMPVAVRERVGQRIGTGQRIAAQQRDGIFLDKVVPVGLQ